mgnify:CR=1 FL=1
MRLLLRSTFRIFDCAEDRSLRKNANKSAFASGLFVSLANVMNETFSLFLWAMTVLALAVFVALHFVEAGYGYLFNRKFGPGIPNRIGWMAMESPVFIAMCILWLCSDRALEAGPLALFILFQSHYLQRSFVFPLLIRGRSQMPLGIVLMGMVFNTLNALMQGGWIFYVAPQSDYYADWFSKPYFYVGTAIFLFGFIVNLQSDYIIRHLRKPGDTKHYIPRGGMFRYVSSANYFGDLVKKETGKSAQEYIQLKVIDIAKERMFDTTKSISEIAYELGFRYPQHFTRLFKKCVGQSPNEYRTQN